MSWKPFRIQSPRCPANDGYKIVHFSKFYIYILNVNFKKLSSRAKPQTISLNKTCKTLFTSNTYVFGARSFQTEPSCPKGATSNKKVNHFHILSFPPFSNLLDRFLEVSNRTNENNQT
jgi:hypothetical protein